MVSPDKLKNGEVDFSKLANNKGMRRKRKPSSMLKSKKFFLYFKNLSLQTKYETQLKTFGATVVPYIDKEVNYLLTDTPGYNGKPTVLSETPSLISPQCYSVSPATSVSGDDFGVVKRTRTRTEAMLERVNVQSQSVCTFNNPINNALSWNIPVYSVDCFQNLLNKKLSQIQWANERIEPKNDKNIRVFEKRYLKLEHIIGNRYRPEFKEVSRWPSIDTNSFLGSYPFEKKSSRRSARRGKDHEDKKESERMNRTCNKTANEAGYCEICTVHYTDLSQHVTSSTHLKFTCNDKNYADLDNCIKTRSIEAFLAAHHSNDNSCAKEASGNEEMGRNLRKSVSLHLNNNNENSSVTKSLSNAKLLADESLKQPLQVQCNGFTNYHLRKSTNKSDSVLMKSPTMFNNKDLLHENRKLYASCPDNNGDLSPIEEDSLHRLRSRKNLLLPAILIGTTAEDSNKHRNALSPQTPTSNRFLRSSSSPRTKYATRSKLPAEEGCKKSNMSHSPRSSLGLKMNNVASENNNKRLSRASASPKDELRMNGGKSCKRKSSITASDEDEKRDSRSFSSRNVPSYQCSTRNNFYHETSEFNNTDKGGQHRKRLSVEEKFLEDNKEYYKVEMLRTKLRSTEFYCNRESPGGQATMRKEDAKGEPKSDSDEPMALRHKKQRLSALHLLNLEATNFMFGPSRKDDSRSSEEDELDDHQQLQTREEKREDKGTKESKKQIEKNKSSPCHNFSKQQSERQIKDKKRRTHAEVFIHDNLDYYKFEISGSRLRHQNTEESASQIKPEPSTTNQGIPSNSLQNGTTTKVKEEVMTDDEVEVPLIRRRGKTRKPAVDVEESEPVPECETTATETKEEPADLEAPDGVSTENQCCDRPTPPADSVRFAFESVPYKEPWFKAFQRFDTCGEQYIPISDAVHFSRYRDVLPVGCGRRRRDVERNSTTNSPSSKDNSLLAHFRRRRKQRFSRLIIEDNPRKSPRCHASTLAILSSLTGHRRRSRKLISPVKLQTPAKQQTPAKLQSPVKLQKSTPAPVVVNKTTDLEKKLFLAEVSREHQARLKEAVNMMAKDVDEYFIDLFSKADCGDTYFDRLKSNPGQKSTVSEPDNLHCCMQIDLDILQDEEFLKALANDHPCFTDNMSEFLESSQRCTSMETAQDEELIIPRSHDPLSRLCRENNDFSCNSSDCGASSTCEFLGFAEDGRTVSRKRKRKRPNMTGWPHERNKRRQMRILRIRRNVEDNSVERELSADVEDKIELTAAAGCTGETASELDTDCTDDDIPLNELVKPKRRRTNNSLSASVDAIRPAESPPRKKRQPAVSSRRSPKISPAFVGSRRLTPMARRKAAACGRRTRYI